jgi:hypothetical protein
VEVLRAAPTGEALETSREIIERQVVHMVRLIEDLLDVSRITRGTIALQKEQVDLAKVVSDAVEANRPLVDGRRHVLEVKAPAEPLLVDGDPTRLTQAVGNLLNNACKFTEPGGRIEIEVTGNRRAGSCGFDADYAAVRVKDSGIGLAADELSRIFDMFTQVDTSLERSQSGLGIGLTLAKKLVEMHGGQVEAHSAGIGQGSEFVVRLPIAKAASSFADACSSRVVAVANRVRRCVREEGHIRLRRELEPAPDGRGVRPHPRGREGRGVQCWLPPVRSGEPEGGRGHAGSRLRPDHAHVEGLGSLQRQGSGCRRHNGLRR